MTERGRIHQQKAMTALFKGKHAMVIRGVHTGQSVLLGNTFCTAHNGTLIDCKFKNDWHDADNELIIEKGQIIPFYNDELMCLESKQARVIFRGQGI